MTKRTWPADQKDEYDRICQEAWDAGDSTRDRTEAFIDKIRDAEQAHRMFARDILREALFRGMSAILKRWHKSRRTVAISYEGDILTHDKLLSRVVGIRNDTGQGGWYYTQTLFELLTFEQVAEKLREFQTQQFAYTINVHVYERILALKALVPSANTPAEACQHLGITIDQYLAIAA